MQILTIGFVIPVINLISGLAIPAKVLQTNFHADIIPAGSEFLADVPLPSAQIANIEQATNLTEPGLQVVPKLIDVSAIKTAAKKNGDSTERVGELESDYSYLADKMPDLPEDEYLAVDENSTPFEFLKNQADAAAALNIPPHLLAAFSRNPIFITMPVYINVGGGLSLHLQMGSKQMEKLLQLRQHSQHSQQLKGIVPTDFKELSPTSQFNRLLRNYNDMPQQQVKSTRATKKKRKKSSSRTTAESRNTSYKFYF